MLPGFPPVPAGPYLGWGREPGIQIPARTPCPGRLAAKPSPPLPRNARLLRALSNRGVAPPFCIPVVRVLAALAQKINVVAVGGASEFRCSAPFHSSRPLEKKKTTPPPPPPPPPLDRAAAVVPTALWKQGRGLPLFVLRLLRLVFTPGGNLGHGNTGQALCSLRKLWPTAFRPSSSPWVAGRPPSRVRRLVNWPAPPCARQAGVDAAWGRGKFRPEPSGPPLNRGPTPPPEQNKKTSATMGLLITTTNLHSHRSAPSEQPSLFVVRGILQRVTGRRGAAADVVSFLAPGPQPPGPPAAGQVFSAFVRPAGCRSPVLPPPHLPPRAGPPV